MADETTESKNSQQFRPWQMGLAAGFMMAVVLPSNTGLLRQLSLGDTWTGMLVVLPVMLTSGIAIAIVRQRWLRLLLLHCRMD